MHRIIRAGIVLAAILMVGFAGQSNAAEDGNQQVVVCKYVGTPGVDERLQTGQNPIVVSENALAGDGFDGTFPFEFSDAQGRSIAIRFAENSHDGDISECPEYVAPTPNPTVEPSPEPSAEPSDSPSETPGPITGPSSEPSTTTSPSTPKVPRATMPNTAVEDVYTSGPRSLSLLLAALVGLAAGIYMLLKPTPMRRKRR